MFNCSIAKLCRRAAHVQRIIQVSAYMTMPLKNTVNMLSIIIVQTAKLPLTDAGFLTVLRYTNINGPNKNGTSAPAATIENLCSQSVQMSDAGSSTIPHATAYSPRTGQ